MEFFLIYLYTLLLKSSILVEVGFLGCVGLSTVLAVVMLDSAPHIKDKSLDLYKKWIKLPIGLLVVGGVLVFLVPSKSDLAMIVGGGVVYNIGSTDEAKRLPDNVLESANNFLERINKEDVEN